MSNHFPRTPLSDILITETVRSIEGSRSLEDSKAMQHAFAAATGREARLLERGWFLGNELQLPAELQRWKKVLRYAAFLLALLAAIFGAGIAASVTAQNRTLNAPYALLLALGPNFIALLLWFITLWRPGLSEETSIGSLLLRGTARLPLRRGPYFWTVLNTAMSLLARRRLLPWLFGIASHAFWTIALLLVLAALGISFSFQAYRLTWETTILPAEFFVSFVRVSGWLPHQLGFPLPDAATLLNPAAHSSDHRAWAWWLIGCITVYGLLPRLVLAGISGMVWQVKKRRLRLDLAHPYFVKLLARFNEMEPTKVVDPEQRQERLYAPLTREAAPGEAQTLAIIGFELPQEIPFPPQPALQEASFTERIAGSNQERHSVLQELGRRRPYRLLFVCHAASSPDRGTARFLRDAAAHAVRCALLLVHVSGTEAGHAERWQGWLAAMDLEAISCFTRMEEVNRWKESNYE